MFKKLLILFFVAVLNVGYSFESDQSSTSQPTQSENLSSGWDDDWDLDGDYWPAEDWPSEEEQNEIDCGLGGD